MGTGEAQATQEAWPSGSARPRLVLGMVLLMLGVGDLLYMNLVLLPQVLAVEAVASPRPVVSRAPAPGAPSPAGPQALAVAPAASSAASPTEDPALPTDPPSAPAALVPTAQPSAPSPTPAVAPAPPPSARPSVAAEPLAPALAPPPPAPSQERAGPAFAPLRFSSNSAWLSPGAGQTLAKLATVMKSDSTLRVALDGHTDDYGPERFNQVLSLKRAERVRARLEELGVARARIDIKGYGSAQPADTKTTAKARARNRRVEITLN